MTSPLTPEQITASRDRLLAEGFHPDSAAIRVHDRHLSVTRALALANAANEVTVERAVKSMDDLKAECERLRASLEAARSHAISQDCGRMCDGNPSLKQREQWKRSEAFVDGLIRRAVAEAAAASEAA